MGALVSGSLLKLKNVLQIGSSTSDLLSIISYIEGRINSDKSISDQINKCIEDALQKAGRTNYLDMRPSDKKLLEIVINEYYGENPDIPSWFRDGEFKKFYDSLIDNSDFLGILQGLKQDYNASRQNKKLGDVGQSIQDIKDYIEKQGEQQSTQLNNVLETVQKDSDQIQEKQERQLSLEKEILEKVKNNSKSQKQIIAEPEYPIWLRPYDATEYYITAKEEKELFSDKEKINSITNKLNSIRICLIKAPEGRGKTTICRLIAKNYHDEEGFVVHYIDFSKDQVDSREFEDILKNWKGERKKYLLILENLHANHNLKSFVRIINRFRESDESDEMRISNLYFLLNTRPTEIDEEELEELEESCFESFAPNADYVKGIANRHNINDETELNVLVKRIYPSRSIGGANLRLMEYILNVRKKYNVKSFSNITDDMILKSFHEPYGLDKSLCEKQKEALQYLSSLYQFEVPLPSCLLDATEQKVFESLKACCPLYDEKYHLPNSTEAYLLFKAICKKYNEEYSLKAKQYVHKFIQTILSRTNPKDFEREFKMLTDGLLSKQKEYQELIMDLTNWETAGEIMEQINPGFMMMVFNTKNGHPRQERLAQYLVDRNKIKIILLKTNDRPLFCYLLYKVFKKYYKYDGFVEDMLQNLDDMSVMFNANISKTRTFTNDFKSKIRGISEDHKRIFDDYLEITRKGPVTMKKTRKGPVSKQYDYYFYTVRLAEFQPCISNTRISHIIGALYKGSFDSRKFQQLIFGMNKYGFYFKDLHWPNLSRFVYWLKTYLNEENEEYFKSVTRKIVSEVLQQPLSFQYASMTELSLFFSNVSAVDQIAYSQIIYDANANADARKRIMDFEYTYSDFYFFSHFYSQDWFKTKMNSLIDKANKEQQKVIKEWHDKVLEGLQKEEKAIEEGTLLDYIHNKPFIQ